MAKQTWTAYLQSVDCVQNVIIGLSVLGDQSRPHRFYQDTRALRQRCTREREMGHDYPMLSAEMLDLLVSIGDEIDAAGYPQAWAFVGDIRRTRMMQSRPELCEQYDTVQRPSFARRAG